METIWRTRAGPEGDAGTIYLAIGYQYLDEPEPRMPRADTSGEAVVRDYLGYGRDVVFFCDPLGPGASAAIRRNCPQTWHAEGLDAPLYLSRDVQDALSGDFGE
ncbi:hypothetical protein GXW82_05775 [Streptacidiphilus sp. 4-A2]|nr:hypothetical protein [Streptacidiphilus sp. 4-A2]